MTRPRGWLLLLCVLLCVWEPVNLALAASSAVGQLAIDGTGRAAFLLARLLTAGIGVAAGIAIWNKHPHAVMLAKAVLGLSALMAVVRFAWFPGNTPPGLRFPLALLLVGYNVAWYVYLMRVPEAPTGADMSEAKL